MMPSYYTPPPSAGSHWSQPMFPRPSPSTFQQNPPLHPTPPPNPNQSHYASVVMQQLQNFSYNVPHHQPQFTHNQQQQSVFEQPKMPSPQPSDNALLAKVLYEQTKRGLTYKAALESLHGHNGIMAYAWKDYFLENKQAIDAMVDQLMGQGPSPPVIPSKQRSPSPVLNNGVHPSPSEEESRSQSFSQQGSKASRRTSEEPSASISRREKSKEATPSRSLKLKIKIKAEKTANDGKLKHRSRHRESNGSSRRTLNSLSSAPSNALLAKVPPAVVIDNYTGLPAAPSRSPSPPPPGPNSRYTEQDAIFFFRRIAYDLARDPDLSKAKLCEFLGEKAPHHSAASWRTYWHKHEDVADKMYLLTQLDEEDRQKAIQSWKGSTAADTGSPSSRVATRGVSYRESSGSESGDYDSEASEAGSSKPHSNDESSGDSSDGEDADDALESTDEELPLGEAGSAFTIAEKRVLAKHIASKPYWFKGRKQWDNFFSTYRQRTEPSWREFYRRKQDEIDALAKKYIRKAKKKSETAISISTQRGRPSWARPDNATTPTSGTDNTVPIKRKLSASGSRERSENKRSKTGEDLE